VTMHRRLRRLLELHLGPDRPASPELESLVRDLDADYRRAEEERASLRRALDLVADLSRRAAAPPPRPNGAQGRLSRLSGRLLQDAPFAAVLADRGLTVLAWNPAAERLFGFRATEAVGRDLPSLLFADPDRAAASRDLRSIAERGEVDRSVRTARTRSGEARADEWTLVPLRDGGRVEGVAALVREPPGAPDRHARAVEGTGDAAFEWDLAAGELWLSDAWAALVGEPAAGRAPAAWLDRIHASERDTVEVALKAHLDGKTDRFESEHRLRDRASGWRWVLARGQAVRDGAGKAIRFSGSFMDVTRRREEAERALHEALHDPLTRFPNRSLFLDLVKRSFARTRRKGEYAFAVVFLDLDRFKAVNDALGHAAGDELLVQVARRLQTCLREGDTLARHGGDEFTILLDDVKGAEDARTVADRIHQVTAQPFDISGHEVFATASIGIALSGPGYTRPEDLLLDADTAMYRAKAQGRARSVVFDASMRDRAPQLLDLEGDLRRALLRNEFRIHYLPVVDVSSGRIQGLEALIRWAHPKRGLVSPKDFVPFAEETGLIIPIGRWLLQQAGREFVSCRRAAQDGRLMLHVNLSCKQLLNSDFIDEIDDVFLEGQLDPKDLAVELTEDTLEHVDQASLRLAALRDRGVTLYIDDFGTGSSSINSLYRFGLDSLKIDRSLFVGGSPRGPAPDLVRSIVSMAREMGKPVVAEGVETAEQFQFLRELGCSAAQGFYFSPPVEGDVARALVARGPSW
jgi:diguanylate cyclase (GGDEF)-like protein/PAS domain S-box-containing protein